MAAINAHSDNKFIEDAGYVIKTLLYHSQKATTFMRRVDEEIAKAKNIEGKKSQKHERVESKTPNLTAFGRAPQGLPIDFYDPKW